MPQPWFYAALLITFTGSELGVLVPSQRQPTRRPWLRLYLYTLRHPVQAVRDFGWGVAFLALLLLVYLSPILGFGLLLLDDHSTSVLLPGYAWISVLFPVVTVVFLELKLSQARRPPSEQQSPEQPTTEGDH